MSRQLFWRGLTPLSDPFSKLDLRVLKLCYCGDRVLALGADQFLYICDVDENKDTIQFKSISNMKAIDLACDGVSLFTVDANGRLYKSPVYNVEAMEEMVARENARCCPHGFKIPSFKVKFRNVVASEFGCLFTTNDGQLWGTGVMPQIALNTPHLQKITFFEGRTVYGASIGSNFAAVISRRNIKKSESCDTESEDDDVCTDCADCRSRVRSHSPSLALSPSQTCPLGVDLHYSSSDCTAHVPQKGSDTNITEETSHTRENTENFESRIIINCRAEVTSTVKLSETDHDDASCINAEKLKNIFTNTNATKQFLSRQLSWVSAGEDYFAEYTELPTRIIKENMSNLTNLVYEGVKNVGDRVATLSRHVSGGSEGGLLRPLEPCDSLLYTCTSSYKLDELQFSTSTLASDKDCDTSTNEKIQQLAKLGQNILSTELWIWGDIQHGQLGIGDTITRMKPMLVTSLSGHGLQKVSCGRQHCAALTLDGRIFTWGHNHYHQVSCESREDRSSPVQFSENTHSNRMRDIDAADDHTVAHAHDNSVYYLGKYFSEYTDKVTQINKTGLAKVINVDSCETNSDELSSKKLEKLCNHWRISTSGHLTCCYTDESQSRTLCDLALAQNILEPMLLIQYWIIKPFLKNSKSIINHTNIFDMVCELFTDILNVTALNVLSMWQHTEHHLDQREISILKNCELYIHLYKKYLDALCNFISVSGFTEVTNVLVDVPMSIQKLFHHELPQNHQNNTKKSSEAIIAWTFALPLARLNAYRSVLESILASIDKDENRGNVDDSLGHVMPLWDSLIDEEGKKRREAEVTKLFWETTGKVLEQYRTPERRLIRESRSTPLNLVHAGRFSSHWFVLFNDAFLHISGSTQTVHPLKTFWVEPIPNTETSQNVIQLITPEETLSVSTSTCQEKTEWVHTLQTAIKLALNKGSDRKPPSLRTASYTFTKSQVYKEAKYTGRWLDGKMHGHGRVEWTDGKVYVGQFQHNCFHGQGKMEIPDVGVYEGEWKDNLQNGYGIMKYSSGDVYEGHFKDGLSHGHGIRRQGDFTTSTATIYLGEWCNGQKHGYGVMDDIGKGEKYLGSWSENKKHGCGLIVTLDGIYYEGVFMQDVLTGHGVMIFEDNTHYEGEFRSAGVFSGKGVLTFSSGDKIEGCLNGAWTEGVKISNATLQMNVSNPAPPVNAKPNSFGKLCVAPHQKWNALFRHCNQSLGISENLLTPLGSHFATGGSPTVIVDNKRIWRKLAAVLSSSHKSSSKPCSVLMKSVKSDLEDSVDSLEVIPQFGQSKLDLHSYMDLKNYIQKACETSHHPLGQLVFGLTNAFNTTYGGVHVHPLLLSHAVKELKSITSRLYQVVRLLFPALPAEGSELFLPYSNENDEDDNNPMDGEVVSAASLLQPALLPRVHPSLFVLYALHNKREDDLYWRRLLKWNKQSDLTLMAFLGIDQKFWMNFATHENSAGVTPVKEQLLTDAVETLQQLKTTFSPIEKLLVIRTTFQRMTAAMQKQLGESYLWSMDELFPLFHFVVLRARILQLGSEIHFVEDFLEPALQHGELGIMFTTLKACYFQIHQEKVTMTP